MIRKISLGNFKLFRKKTVFDRLTSINILTGINGRGKSTLFQSLLLPRQSLMNSMYTKQFILNDPLVKLGNAIDVKNKSANRSSHILFGYEVDSQNVELYMSATDENDQFLTLNMLNINGVAQDISDIPIFGFLPNTSELARSPFVRQLLSITYISADRKGPDLSYKASKDVDFIDPRGEYVPCVLYNHNNDAIDKSLIESLYSIFPGLSDEDTQDVTTVQGMLDFWMSKMFGSTKVKTNYIFSVNLYSLNYTVNNNVREYKPTNVGFGYSYVLPIFVAGLTAHTDQILIIENPEAHLHPMAQSILGKFLSWISVYGGVQVFVETHSEHIVNSFRVLLAQQVIKSKDVNILFFDDDFVDYYKKIEVDDKGRISCWPARFFDQEEIDLNILV